MVNVHSKGRQGNSELDLNFLLETVMRGSHFLLVTLTVFSYSLVASADDKALNPAEASAVADVQQRADQIKAINRSLWELAEVGLQERKSSALLIGQLKEAGFTVKEGVADMPTAFVASYGSGRPIIGILAEYDALPGKIGRAHV